jgi:porin-like protein
MSPLHCRVAAALLVTLVTMATSARAQDKPVEKPKIELSGYLQLDYRHGEGGEPPAAVHEVNGRRARIGVAGKVSERVSYSLVLQGDGLNAVSASILDATIGVKLSSWARVQAGQFKYDFDLQGRESDALLLLSDRPDATQVVAGGLSGSSTPSTPSGSFRDRGLTFTASSPSARFQGAVGVFQGNGRASDNNASFTPVLRLTASPVKGVLVSGGFLRSETADAGKPEPGRYVAWTIGAALDKGPYSLRGEYYRARRTRAADEDLVHGFYVHGARTIAKNFEAMLRFQQLTDPLVAAQGSVSSLDLGARYFLARLGARGGTSLLVNVLLRDAPGGTLRGMTVLNDGRGAPVTSGDALEPVVVARLQVQF